MKICGFCGLDIQCCFHNKNDYQKEIQAIRRSCKSYRGEGCDCVTEARKIACARYQTILANLPPEVKIQMPGMSELSDIYRTFIDKNPSHR